MNAKSTRKQNKSYPQAKFKTHGDVTDFLGELQAVPEEPASSNTLNLDHILIRESQPRRYFDEDKLEQLANSIREHGILENLIVRPSPQEEGKYELVSGERRYRAARIAGLEEVPVKVYELGDEQVLEIALIENLQREDLNPVEETEGIIQLLSHRMEQDAEEIPNFLKRLLQKQKRNQGKSHNVMGQKELEILKELFAQLGRMTWESFTSNRLPLLNLPEDILEQLRKGKIEYTKAKIIAQVPDEEERKNLLTIAIEQNLSIRAIREKVKQIQETPADLKIEPPKRVDRITKQIKKEKLWQNSPERWQQIEAYLQRIEELLEKAEED